MSIRKMIALHPDVEGHVNQPLGDAAHHLMYCARMCLSCADACAAEKMDMRECIRMCLDCADVCEAAGTAPCGGRFETSRCCARCWSCALAFVTHAQRSARSTARFLSASPRCAGNVQRTVPAERGGLDRRLSSRFLLLFALFGELS